MGSMRPETPLNEDPLLGATMLPSSGEGENSMKVFIQEHLVCLMQPLAEAVTDIQRSIRHIKEGTTQANGISERNMEHISAHEQKLTLLGGQLDRINNDLVTQRNELAEAFERTAPFEGELDLVKLSVSRLEVHIQATADAGKGIPQMIDDVDSRVRQAQLSISETNVNHMAFADRLSEIRNLHDGLNDRHMQMMSTLQQFRSADENTRSQVKRHIATSDKHKKDAQRSFALIEDRLKSAETMLLDTAHKTQTNTKTLKTMSNDLKHVLGEVGEVVGIQQGMSANSVKADSHRLSQIGSDTANASQERAERPAEVFGNKLGRMEEALALVHRNQAFEKESNTTFRHNFDEIIKKTVDEARHNAIQLEAATKTFRSNEDRILRNENRINQCEGAVEKAQKLAEKTDTDTRNLELSIREFDGLVELEKHERDKTNTSVAQAFKEIEAVKVDIQPLPRRLDDIEGALSKIGMRIELAHEYVQGVSKGFQDTHKRVTAGLDGMLPPKTVTNRKMLPDIPGSRAPSTVPEATSPEPWQKTI